jgi:hypothetical protein
MVAIKSGIVRRRIPSGRTVFSDASPAGRTY